MSNYFCHETSLLDDNVSVGKNTKIWHWTHVSSGAQIGSDCIIGQNCFIGKNVKIGNNVKIQNNVSIYEGVVLEDNIFCGPSVVFTNVINPRSFISRVGEFKKTVVRNGCSIGANATIICGLELGSYSFIAAGAVVTKKVKSFSCVSGIPAKQLYWISKCGVKITFKDGNTQIVSGIKYFLSKNRVYVENKD